jgi:hypothetical protein
VAEHRVETTVDVDHRPDSGSTKTGSHATLRCPSTQPVLHHRDMPASNHDRSTTLLPRYQDAAPKPERRSSTSQVRPTQPTPSLLQCSRTRPCHGPTLTTAPRNTAPASALCALPAFSIISAPSKTTTLDVLQGAHATTIIDVESPTFQPAQRSPEILRQRLHFVHFRRSA